MLQLSRFPASSTFLSTKTQFLPLTSGLFTGHYLKALWVHSSVRKAFNKILTMIHVWPFCRKKKADPTAAFNMHETGLSDCKEALEGEILARGAMVPALGGLKRQVSDFKTRNMSLKKLSPELMQKSLPVSRKNTGKKLGFLSAKIFQ